MMRREPKDVQDELTDLREALRIEPSAAFQARVRAAVAEDGRRRVRWLWWSAGLVAAGLAAVIVGPRLVRTAQPRATIAEARQQSRDISTAARHAAAPEVPATVPAPSAGGETHAVVASGARVAGRAPAPARRPSHARRQASAPRPEVLVPVSQRVGFAQLVAAARRGEVVLPANWDAPPAADAAGPRPSPVPDPLPVIEIAPVTIEPIALTPIAVASGGVPEG